MSSQRLEICEGLSKEILRKGDETCFPEPGGQTLHVHFTCTLASSGEVVDSTRGESRSTMNGITVLKQNHPLRLELGTDHSIKGFALALPTMSLGEQALFWVRADLAYGSQGKGPAVPPNSDLIFDIHLLGIDKKYAPPSP